MTIDLKGPGTVGVYIPASWILQPLPLESCHLWSALYCGWGHGWNGGATKLGISFRIFWPKISCSSSNDENWWCRQVVVLITYSMLSITFGQFWALASATGFSQRQDATRHLVDVIDHREIPGWRVHTDFIAPLTLRAQPERSPVENTEFFEISKPSEMEMTWKVTWLDT